MTNADMPNLFVIGAAKCGTSSLHQYLNEHPDVSMSSVKEPGFFIQGVDPARALAIKERKRYLSLFEAGHRIRGESTVAYSTYPCLEGIPEAIADEVPDASFLYLVRDPIERIAAMVRQGIAVGFIEPEDPTVPASVRECIGRLDDPGNRFIAGGKYMTQAQRFVEVFSKESILVIDSDELRFRRRETMAEIFRFLDCDPEEVRHAFGRMENVGSDLTLKPAPYRWLRRRRRLRRWYRRRPDETREALGGRLGALFGKPIPKPVIDAPLRRDLEEVFRPEVEALREFTGKPFSAWSI